MKMKTDEKSSKSRERITFQSLAKVLAERNLENYLEEITDNILASPNPKSLGSCKGVLCWSVADVTLWILSLKFLEPKNEQIAIALEQECINGVALMDTNMNSIWSELHLEMQHYFLIRCILNGWTQGYGKALICPEGIPSAVVAGIAADLSCCEIGEALELVEADRQCSELGIGYIYGQLVVLGYKEHRIQGETWQPVGWSNDKFIMKRRKLPNGIRQRRIRHNKDSFSHSYSPHSNGLDILKQTSHTVSIAMNYGSLSEYDDPLQMKEEDKVVYEYTPDPSKDMFQIGRLGSNDFVVKGPLHYDDSMITCGPLSRYACRIEVSRKAPFTAKIFAAGFSESQDISLGISAPKWFDKDALPENRWRTFDALTTYGVKLWRPDVKEWCEISVKGNAFRVRTVSDEVGEKLGLPFSNELIEGSLIDICGAVFIFQSPSTMANLIRKHVNPSDVILSLNNLRPQCPVLFNPITFSYINNEERIRRAYRVLEASGESFTSAGPMHIPTTNYEHLEEENRAYVFPSCGHVHGFHKSLQDKPCPLCREKGAFVPIAFAFESAICCSARPTHVFNPCGHVASKQVCKKWSNIPVHGPHAISPILKPFCPFCAKVLNDASEGGPYNRLILQTESGEDWENDEEVLDDEILKPVSSSKMELVGDEDLSFHTLLFLKDQSVMNAKLKNSHLSKVAFTTPQFPKFTPQLDHLKLYDHFHRFKK